MKMTRTFLVLAALAVGGTACSGANKFIVSDGWIGSRGEKTLLLPVGGDKKTGMLYNYILRICDVDANGGQSNCKDSTVLEKVVYSL